MPMLRNFATKSKSKPQTIKNDACYAAFVQQENAPWLHNFSTLDMMSTSTLVHVVVTLL